MNIFKYFFLAALIMSVPKLSFAEKAFSFDGQVDFSKNEFNIVFDLDEKSSVVATARKISETDYQFLIDIEHVKTPLFDLLSKIESSVEVIDGDNASQASPAKAMLQGKIWSQYTLIDYKPIQELSGGFKIEDQRLHLTELSFGKLKCDGYMDLVQPYKLNLSFNLFDVDMNDFLNFWNTNATYESAGAVSGKIKASGTFDNLALKGSLQSRNGFVQKLDYDLISLNIEGIYPHMRIAHSTVSKSDGVSFTLDGPFNLNDRKHFKKQIKALTIAPLVNDSGSESEWTIKRLNLEDSGVTEVKYHRRKGDLLGTGTSASDEADMLGFERTQKF